MGVSARGLALRAAGQREAGQMAVEMAVALPVLLIVAIISVNALLFFSECAAYDAAFRDAVRASATSLGYKESVESARSTVSSMLDQSFRSEYLSQSVAVSEEAGGLSCYEGTLSFSPTLFGMGLRSSVLGVAMPSLTHRVCFSVDRYRPSVVL